MKLFHFEGGEHYTRKYNYDGHIVAIFCNYCDYGVSRLEVRATKIGHKWPRMSHNIKRHLRDKHGINLYKRKV